MTNTVTNAERQRLYTQARLLLDKGHTFQQATEALRSTGISRQRARHAVAKAILRKNRPNR